MPLSTRRILGILAENLNRRGSIFPLPSRKLTAWAEGLGLPKGGGTVLYTGHMYQLMPAVSALGRVAARFEDSWVGHFLGLAQFVNKRLNLSSFSNLVRVRDETLYGNVLRNIACLLRTAGMEFGYLGDQELYTGALIHDFGLARSFRTHARKVHEMFRLHGVKRVITVDPHTTNMLRTVYPKIMPDHHLEVKSYLELLADSRLKPVNGLGLDLAVHDPCVYARYENLTEEPRALLVKADAELLESEYSRRSTHCCGGPIEALFPSKARAIAQKRLKQLTALGGNVVTMCPICLVNLREASRNGANIVDISEYLSKAYCGRY